VRGNGSRDLVGRGGLVTTTPDPVAFPDTLIRVRIDAKHFEPRLLRLFWDSQVVRDYLQRTARTTAGIYKINQGDLERLPLPLPPFAEQARLAGEIERLDSVATVEAGRVDSTRVHMTRLRQSILKWAFEGRLVDPGQVTTPPPSASAQNPATMRRSASTEPSTRR
jgi:type I restriction enzyme, S subunit